MSHCVCQQQKASRGGNLPHGDNSHFPATSVTLLSVSGQTAQLPDNHLHLLHTLLQTGNDTL